MRTRYPLAPKFGNFFQKATVILHILWLYFSSILLLLLFAICFWSLSQGIDVLVKTTEYTTIYSGMSVMLAMFFWVYVIWYSGRVIGYQQPKEAFNKAEGMYYHLPRLQGFYIYAVFVLAFLNAMYPQLFNAWILLAALLVYYFIYRFLDNVSEAIAARYVTASGEYSPRLTAICRAVFWSNFFIILLNGFVHNAWVFIISATVLQVLFVFLVVNRRKMLPGKMFFKPLKILRKFLLKIYSEGNVPETEEVTFAVFNVVSIVALLVYLFTVSSLKLSIQTGTLAVVMLAMGFYTGLFNMIKMFSKMYRIAFGFFLVLLMFIGGLIFETHYVATFPEKDTNIYSKRLNLENYFINWLDAHENELNNDTTSIVPLIFAHADGGASRSGYWTASVLGMLDDSTNYKFSKHLFCLSGASGGSVGNATYFSLLYLRQGNNAEAKTIKDSGMVLPAQRFLKTDFLTYTIARMLGPDAFRTIIPIYPDRARALEFAMEQGAGDTVLLNRFFATHFSQFAALPNSLQQMPIICINVTRMQDGNPGVVSNITIDTTVFGQRVDVAGLLAPGKDIHLSTAAAMGARFPYISPAGRIDGHTASGKTQPNYFVDGGYFDNSGAGVIHEMIIYLQKLIQENKSLQSKWGNKLSKIKFIDIHITNTPPGNADLHKVHPFKNDLAAPLITLAGSYGSQTSVNDSRLEKYLQNIYQNDSTLKQSQLGTNYFDINLYRSKADSSFNDSTAEESYPMNWSISDTVLHRMNERLENHRELHNLITILNKVIR